MSLAAAVRAYVRIRSLPYVTRDRSDFLVWQSARVQRWLRRDVPEVAAFQTFAGKSSRLDDLPVMEKPDLMADFSRYNVPAITNDQGWQAFAGDRRIGDYIVGASTGTSGNRGLFVISQCERFAWLGAILAKALPDFWRYRDRIALLLPLDTPLYDSANRTKRLTLRFFDTNLPIAEHRTGLRALDPTVLIAPPRILRQIAEMDLGLSPRRVFSCAEKLEHFDRVAIEAAFRVPLREIYMATEGLLGVTCAHGRMHLAEDCMHFGFEDREDGLSVPVISDFSRTTQIMVRYRLNDLIRLGTERCSCGSPLRLVDEIVGREDDIVCLIGDDGREVELTPDILRNVIVDTDRAILDFQLVQTGPSDLALYLPAATLEPVREQACRNVGALLHRHGISDCSIGVVDLTPNRGTKLRRVMRAWHPGDDRTSRQHQS